MKSKSFSYFFLTGCFPEVIGCPVDVDATFVADINELIDNLDEVLGVRWLKRIEVLDAGGGAKARNPCLHPFIVVSGAVRLVVAQPRFLLFNEIYK